MGAGTSRNVADCINRGFQDCNKFLKTDYMSIKIKFIVDLAFT